MGTIEFDNSPVYGSPSILAEMAQVVSVLRDCARTDDLLSAGVFFDTYLDSAYRNNDGPRNKIRDAVAAHYAQCALIADESSNARAKMYGLDVCYMNNPGKAMRMVRTICAHREICLEAILFTPLAQFDPTLN